MFSWHKLSKIESNFPKGNVFHWFSKHLRGNHCLSYYQHPCELLSMSAMSLQNLTSSDKCWTPTGASTFSQNTDVSGNTLEHKNWNPKIYFSTERKHDSKHRRADSVAMFSWFNLGKMFPLLCCASWNLRSKSYLV